MGTAPVGLTLGDTLLESHGRFDEPFIVTILLGWRQEGVRRSGSFGAGGVGSEGGESSVAVAGLVGFIGLMAAV